MLAIALSVSSPMFGYVTIYSGTPARDALQDCAVVHRTKMGPYPAVSPVQVDQSGTIGFYEYDFLIVINCTRGRILHSFRDSLRHVQRRYIWLHLLRFNPDGGVSLGRSS